MARLLFSIYVNEINRIIPMIQERNTDELRAWLKEQKDPGEDTQSRLSLTALAL